MCLTVQGNGILTGGKQCSSQGMVGFEIQSYFMSLNSAWGSFGVGEMH